MSKYDSSDDSFLAEIRQLLAQDTTPELGNQIHEIFLRWDKKDPLRVSALDYACEQLKLREAFVTYHIDEAKLEPEILRKEGLFPQDVVPELVGFLDVSYQQERREVSNEHDVREDESMDRYQDFWKRPYVFDFLRRFKNLFSINYDAELYRPVEILELYVIHPTHAMELVERLESFLPTFRSCDLSIENRFDYHPHHMVTCEQSIRATKKRGEAWDIDEHEYENDYGHND